MKTSIYDFPEYYELAYSFRDVTQEAHFMHRCIEEFSRIPVENILEIGSGHAPHAGVFSSLGYKYIGLDKNTLMIEYAAEKWKSLRPPLKLVRGDMVDFHLDTKVDFTYVMLGSLYLNSNEQLHSHFGAVARAMPPGGLYFLDWCVQVSDPMARSRNNKIRITNNGITIESGFETNLVDSINQIYEERWKVNINDHGEKRTLTMIEQNRAMFPQEFLLFIENHTEFELVGWWHEWDLSHSLDLAGESVRPLVILRRC